MKFCRYLSLVAVLSCSSYALISSSVSAFAAETQAPEVGLDELKKLVASKSATVIDVNGDDTYKTGHIPGAINFAAQKDNLAKVLPKDKNALIVAYCGGPMCVAWKKAAEEATKLGYTNIKHYKGGLKGWKEGGQTLEKGG